MHRKQPIKDAHDTHVVQVYRESSAVHAGVEMYLQLQMVARI